MAEELNGVLQELTKVLEARKQADSDSSYVASLHQKGLNKILEKVGEESVEMILAAKDAKQNPCDSTHKELVYETADLWFHTLVALSHLELGADDVLRELARRFDLSGLEEKANRSKN